MEIGDHYNIHCPHCGRINHDVDHGHSIELGKVTFFKKQCLHCDMTVYYYARYEIQIEAYAEDPEN